MERVRPHLLHPLEDAAHFDSLTFLDGGRAEGEDLDRLTLVREPEGSVWVPAPRRAAAHLVSRPARRHGLLVEGGGVLRDLGHRCRAGPSGGAYQCQHADQRERADSGPRTHHGPHEHHPPYRAAPCGEIISPGPPGGQTRLPPPGPPRESPSERPPPPPGGARRPPHPRPHPPWGT